MMKNWIIGFGLTVWASVAMADLTVVQNLKTSAIAAEIGEDSTMTMKMKGTKARIDFSGMPISSIIDLKSKQLFFMDHKQKQVMIMPLDFIRNILGLSAPGTDAGQDKADLKKTGKVQAINGYTCEEYAGSSGRTMIRCWLADTAEVAELEPFRVYAQDAFKATSFWGLAALKGLIVRSESTVVTPAKTVTNRTELSSLSKAPLDDAVFNLPADYAVMDMPAFPMP